MAPIRSSIRAAAFALAALATASDARTAQAQSFPASSAPPRSGEEVVLRTPAEPEFGSGNSVYTLYAWDFQPADDRIITGVVDPPFARYVVSSTAPYPLGYLEAGAQLPSGALIEGLAIVACDSAPGLLATASLYYFPGFAGSTIQIGLVDTTGFAGCSSRGVFFLAPHTVDNVNNVYAVEVSLPIGDPTVSLRAVKILYRRQVSPSPATQTFDDVPTDHPFFRFVEALVAAGITGGCQATPPLYCPDTPLTRGQMAVFLSVALGLHWPN